MRESKRHGITSQTKFAGLAKSGCEDQPCPAPAMLQSNPASVSGQYIGSPPPSAAKQRPAASARLFPAEGAGARHGRGCGGHRGAARGSLVQCRARRGRPGSRRSCSSCRPQRTRGSRGSCAESGSAPRSRKECRNQASRGDAKGGESSRSRRTWKLKRYRESQ